MRYVLAGLATLASLLFAAPAHADELFYTCGGSLGVLGEHTSCGFARNVASLYPYNHMVYGVVIYDVYSPATGQSYDMVCNPGSVTYFGGPTVNAEVCANNNAQVAVL